MYILPKNCQLKTIKLLTSNNICITNKILKKKSLIKKKLKAI